MRGLSVLALAAALALTACAQTHHSWSPYVSPRLEDWHSGARMIMTYDTNNDGVVTRRELEAGLRQYFWQADTNHDGRLDPDEVAAANQRRIREDKSAAIPLIDWNHDGYVDFDEFAAGIRSTFEDLDADGDGQVTTEEFRRALMEGK